MKAFFNKKINNLNKLCHYLINERGRYLEQMELHNLIQ